MGKIFYAKVISTIAMIMAIFHLYAGGIQLFPATQQRAVHLGLGLALIFLIYPIFKTKSEEQHAAQTFSKFVNIALALAGLSLGAYIFFNFIHIATNLFAPSSFDMMIGLLVIILSLEATRRVLGLTLPLIAIAFLLYAFFGDQLPLMFAHSGYSFERIITQIGLSNEGVFGIALGVSATYLVLFIIFGSLLEASGAGKLFIDLAMALVGRFRGGAAKVSVTASALFGSISGSQVANVVTTGVLTIPLMKRGGYRAEYAGAVEAVASTGGMILPPVMGAVSFLIADFLQVPYTNVIWAALIPALLYFFAVFMMVDLRAARFNEKSSLDIEIPSFKETIFSKGHLLLPLVVLIYLLVVVQWTPPLASFWAILSIPVFSFLRKDTRMSFKQIVEALEQGAKLCLVVFAATTCAGIVIGVVNMTGMGLRFAGVLVELSQGNLFLLLLLTALASIIMGMGLPPVASYVILAILAAPALINLGVPTLAAHMFIFYYGTLSAITPPVAIAVFAASGLAQSNIMKTSFYAVKLATVAFIVPFMFVYGPSLIFEGSAISIVTSAISAFMGVFALAVSFEGYLKQKIHVISRLLLFAGALMLMSVGYMTDLIGVLMISLILLYELKRKPIMGKESISL